MNTKTIIIGIALTVLFGVLVFKNTDISKEFSTSTRGLSEAKASPIVDLKDGDTLDLTASMVKKNIRGKEVRMLAYNGSIPGPTLRVAKGSTVTLNFINKTDTETTLHSHGVRLDNKFDGVPGSTQDPIGVGKSFTYRIKFPDEGVYWYHPHMREDYAQELGLYGNYIVVSDNPSYWSPVDREVPLMVDDILLVNDRVALFSKTLADNALMGRFGNTMLVNGETDYQLSVKKGEVVRFLITNTANTRTFNLAIPGAKIKLVGADGGKYEREQWVNNMIIGPSERVIIEVLFSNEGIYTLEHQTPQRTYVMGKFGVSSSEGGSTFQKEFSALRTNQDMIAIFDPLRQFFNKKADKSIRLAIDTVSMGGMSMSGMNHTMPDGTVMNMGMPARSVDGEKIEWEDTMGMMNQASTADTTKWKIVDEETRKENMAIDWKFKVGDKVKIKIFNDPKSAHPMQHPIHFHGQQFAVVSTNGIKNDNLVWKDTTLVGSGDTVEIILNITNPGTWMAHCHIAEHLESGMMFEFKVVE